MSKLHDDLARLDACSEAQNWAKGYKTLSAAWAACERVDWMLWLIGKTDISAAWSEERKPLVLCSCEIARTALPYTTDPCVLQCIETMEAWCRGEATQDQAWSAESAAWSARSAAWSAESAAWSTESAARSAVYKQSADIVRKHFPKPPRIKP